MSDDDAIETVARAWSVRVNSKAWADQGDASRKYMLLAAEDLIKATRDAIGLTPTDLAGLADGSRVVVEPEPYLIWSNQHRSWWRPNSQGYTKHVDRAGRYSRKEALQICRHGRDGWIAGRAPDEVPVLEADALFCDQGPTAARPSAKEPTDAA